MIAQTFDLNLIPNSSPVVVHCDQYDKGTGRLVISLYDESIAYSPSGTAKIQGTKPDGHGFEYACNMSGNVVTADLTEQMSAVAGQVRCQIVVTESSNRTGTFVFILDVQQSALPDDTVISDSDYQLVEQMLEAATDSEAWAVGERDGIPVGPTDETYHNNSKWYAEQGSPSAFAGLSDVDVTGVQNGQVPVYNSTSSKWENETLTIPDEITDLSDVSISSVQDGQGLIYDSASSKWKNQNIPSGGASELDDLTDVTISGMTDGQVLEYDSALSKWKNASLTIPDELTDMSDVSVSSVQNGQVLKYNSTSSKWENANESGGGSGDYVGLYGTTEIISGTDLNSLTTVGTYYKSATNFTPSHAPVSSPDSMVFILDVRRLLNNDNHIIQTVTYINAIPVFYNRLSTNGGTTWTSWRIEPDYLRNLNDVSLSTPADGSVLTYSSSSSNWYANTPHKVSIFAVDLTGWSSDTTSQSGTTLYKKQITLTNVYVESPSVDIGAGTGYVLPTSAEQESYDLLQYVTVDDTVPCLYLYASAIPTTAFYIKVTGVD